ncbi:uncharacterized protein N7484_008193 [Penicillium longicatenatum]|uniref:uncharacterized protein n=1 Tax=Penicillium longicatenatum TaxID=1561947 RepID=UPI002546B710|nr:uncharacterized protein N7484_008193 [Penicillium longicatenatum]KAJ5640331.1 hypothetical protein N7484_008193 [Penicillium longicatenatum]
MYVQKPGHDLPEINSLDHQIALARGSTMALETMRTRLRYSKGKNTLSLQELKYEKLRQYEQQKNENNFYQSCRDILHELIAAATEVAEDLTSPYDFEPGMIASNTAKALAGARLLRGALEDSRVQEARAEHKWKREWNSSRVCKPIARWI